MKSYLPTQQLIVTPIAGFEKEDPLHVSTGEKLKASVELAGQIMECAGLRLESIRMSPESARPMLWHSAFCPDDMEASANAPWTLRGELEHVKLYRIFIGLYSTSFEFYNSRSGCLARLQPEYDKLRGFVVRCNGKIYKVRYKWSRWKERIVAIVKIKDEHERFYHRQPLYEEVWEEEI